MHRGRQSERLSGHARTSRTCSRTGPRDSCPRGHIGLDPPRISTALRAVRQGHRRCRPLICHHGGLRGRLLRRPVRVVPQHPRREQRGPALAQVRGQPVHRACHLLPARQGDGPLGKSAVCRRDEDGPFGSGLIWCDVHHRPGLGSRWGRAHRCILWLG